MDSVVAVNKTSKEEVKQIDGESKWTVKQSNEQKEECNHID